jgi:hypothetical protein
MNNGKRVLDFTLPSSKLDWFWKVIIASGLRPLLKTNYPYVDWGILTAFSERWQPETGTFHLPVGELTITLDDVSCLLHIPISGKMLNHEGTACKMEEGADMCDTYLNFPKEDCMEEFDKMKGAHLSFQKLLQLYLDNKNFAEKALHEKEKEEDIKFYQDCAIRCFLLYLLGSTLFTNKSTQYVDVIFLTYLQDLDLIHTWNWGASGLAYLFKYLDKSTRQASGNNGGYNCLLQVMYI